MEKNRNSSYLYGDQAIRTGRQRQGRVLPDGFANHSKTSTMKQQSEIRIFLSATNPLPNHAPFHYIVAEFVNA
jgi:hypothetical protein